MTFAVDVEKRRGYRSIHRPRHLDPPPGLHKAVRPRRREDSEIGQENAWLQHPRRGGGGAVGIGRCRRVASAEEGGFGGICEGRLSLTVGFVLEKKRSRQTWACLDLGK
jgi:hypothetical protein